MTRYPPKPLLLVLLLVSSPAIEFSAASSTWEFFFSFLIFDLSPFQGAVHDRGWSRQSGWSKKRRKKEIEETKCIPRPPKCRRRERRGGWEVPERASLRGVSQSASQPVSQAKGTRQRESTKSNMGLLVWLGLARFGWLVGGSAAALTHTSSVPCAPFWAVSAATPSANRPF